MQTHVSILLYHSFIFSGSFDNALWKEVAAVVKVQSQNFSQGSRSGNQNSNPRTSQTQEWYP